MSDLIPYKTGPGIMLDGYVLVKEGVLHEFEKRLGDATGKLSSPMTIAKTLASTVGNDPRFGMAESGTFEFPGIKVVVTKVCELCDGAHHTGFCERQDAFEETEK